jgi:hypothetical protein
MSEVALATTWNLVCLVSIRWALDLWLFWLRLTVVIVSDGDHSWWFATVLAPACIVCPSLRVLFVLAIDRRIASLDVRSTCHNV